MDALTRPNRPVHRRRGQSWRQCRLLITGLVVVQMASNAVIAADDTAAINQVTADTLNAHGHAVAPGHRWLLQQSDNAALVLGPASGARNRADASDPSAAPGAVTLDGATALNGYRQGIPFPAPQSGIEVMWNARLRDRGPHWGFDLMRAVVTPPGNVFRLGVEEYFLDARPVDPSETAFYRIWRFSFPDGRPRATNQDALLWKDRVSAQAGFRILRIQYARGFNKRINLAPSEAHFGGGLFARRFDMVDMYSADFEDKTFKLVGRRTMIMPTRADAPADTVMTLEAFATSPVPDLTALRYAHTPVWIVDVFETQPAGLDIARRRVYVDDRWTPLLIESFANDDALTHVQECHPTASPSGTGIVCRPELVYDVQNERYFIERFVQSVRPPIDRTGGFNTARLR